tara:strand:- start:201 stop:491 length:291 start_codon:yes stop_codon:yes gene_type:complete
VFRNLKKNGIKNSEKIKDPTEPDIVLFGLTFVNFFPLKILPTVSPPISVITEIKIMYIINRYKSGKFNLQRIIIKIKYDKYNKDAALRINLKIILL